MKKLFLAICFIIAGSSQLQARVQEVLDMSSVPQPQQQTQTTNPKVTEVSADGLGNFDDTHPVNGYSRPERRQNRSDVCCSQR